MAHLKGKTILVAEDDLGSFLLVKTILIPHHYNIIHAANGAEAVNHCQGNEQIDLVLMDIKMPIMDGLEATKQIKKRSPELPIIVISAYNLPEDKQKAFDAGCDDFLAKPYQAESLIRIITKTTK